MRTIKAFILFASALVALAFFGGNYYITSSTFTRSVKENAVQASHTLAQITFSSMFQVMSTGWSRAQLEAFLSSLHAATAETSYSVNIYRGERVSEIFGSIVQKAPDAAVRRVFAGGQREVIDQGMLVRHLFPLKVEERCVLCHSNANIGETLGVIDVQQDLEPAMKAAGKQFMLSFLPIIPVAILFALIATLWVNRRIERSLAVLEAGIEKVQHVSDLRDLKLDEADLGFEEFNTILVRINTLVDKLRGIAVDKGLLEFEIRLLEKFVITSEVVRDWREYISMLLADINQVLEVHVLFSLFKVDDELFDLEIFWIAPPAEETRAMMERIASLRLREHPSFSDVTSLGIHHHIVNPAAAPLRIDEATIDVQTKSLLVEEPKIGGIVGIGVQLDHLRDETQQLVMDSVLSTLLNVVGSVRAIYKYTHDLEYYATRDPLTDLYNQRMFWELISYEIDRSRRHNDKFCLLVIDLDNFKTINDSCSHAFGDHFLEQFARTLHASMRAGDILARYGGDEFVAILSETDGGAGRDVAQRILDSAGALELRAPSGSLIKATVSIGMAVFPDHAADEKDLFLFADNMMYKAKRAGKGNVAVPTEEDVVDVFRSLSEKSIVVLNAVEERRIVPYFQPIIASRDGGFAAVEVLSRINLPDGMMLGASEFIEIAEKMGVIHKIDYIVMEKALTAVKEHGFPGLVFVNLSPRAFLVSEFGAEVRRIVDRCGLDPGRIVFEITERETVKNLCILEAFLADLKHSGFKLAIDDFGSGFSSFHYLRRFPVDFVKIEGEFIANMLHDERDRIFVRSITSLARDLGMKVVAEYVEHAEVLDLVAETGIDLAQGYYIGTPSPHLPEGTHPELGLMRSPPCFAE